MDFLALYPGLQKLAAAVLDTPAIVAYFASPLRYPLGGADFVANVRKILV